MEITEAYNTLTSQLARAGYNIVLDPRKEFKTPCIVIELDRAEDKEMSSANIPLLSEASFDITCIINALHKSIPEQIQEIDILTQRVKADIRKIFNGLVKIDATTSFSELMNGSNQYYASIFKVGALYSEEG